MSLATEITVALEIMTRPPPAEGRGDAAARLLALIEDVRATPDMHTDETVRHVVTMRHALITENPGELASGWNYFANLAAEEAKADAAAQQVAEAKQAVEPTAQATAQEATPALEETDHG